LKIIKELVLAVLCCVTKLPLHFVSILVSHGCGPIILKNYFCSSYWGSSSYGNGVESSRVQSGHRLHMFSSLFFMENQSAMNMFIANKHDKMFQLLWLEKQYDKRPNLWWIVVVLEGLIF